MNAALKFFMGLAYMFIGAALITGTRHWRMAGVAFLIGGICLLL